MQTRRSSQASQSFARAKQVEPTSNEMLRNNKPTIPLELLRMNLDEQADYVTRLFIRIFKVQPRSLQVKAVVCLINGDNTFLLAATGYGKTRIAEMYYHLFDEVRKPVVLVLNPLDSLGDNQVLEKEGRISAVNLTKQTMTAEVIKDIKKGFYRFIYLGPEIFLNSEAFEEIYNSVNFQSQLILKVVDEAHMIYMWGLVASGPGRLLSTFKSSQDIGCFRPAYGNLCDQLMATENVPLLLMSATCRPVAIRMILGSLKITPSNITILQGELTRPEICLIRVDLAFPQPTSQDIGRLVAHRSVLNDEELPVTIVYSRTQDATLNVLAMAQLARGSPEDFSNGTSSFIRRYHAITGSKDKEKRAKDFVDGRFPWISSTSALGLGSNWTAVSCVVVIGRMDPSTITQMVGRAGRSGNSGLGIIFVEPNRPSGKNKIADFDQGKEMEDDDRMDALAVTPVCLRVALSIDNLFGYIPLSINDQRYQDERAREQAACMAVCMCSNCEPDGAVQLINAFPKTSRTGLQHLIETPILEPSIPKNTTTPYLWSAPKVVVSSLKPMVCKRDDPIRMQEDFVELAVSLVGHFEGLFRNSSLKNSGLKPEVCFSRENPWLIVKNYQLVLGGLCLRKLLGSQAIPGTFEMFHNVIQLWLNSDAYSKIDSTLEGIQVQEDQNYLDELLIEAEHEAEKNLQKQNKIEQAKAVAERKRERLEKAAQKYERQELARENRRKKIEGDTSALRERLDNLEVNDFKLVHADHS